jgi:menaquinol-cytochrome c reductase cytochrome b/c subunit
MNQAEKEQYLREYSLLKNEGKPFFPYAVAKDSIMAVITIIVIMLLSLLFGAELGPKVNPTTTTYVPRPDWYFFFLFEVLRVMKNVPKFTPMATIGVPTLCMIALFLLPLYDRSPERLITRRPIALAAGLATILCIAYLTYSGANTGSPNQVSVPLPPGLTKQERATFLAGEIVVGESGCEGCHEIGGYGNNGPGPPLTDIGARRSAGAIASTLKNPTAPMPSFANLAKTSPKKFEDLVGFLSMLNGSS